MTVHAKNVTWNLFINQVMQVSYVINTVHLRPAILFFCLFLFFIHALVL